MGCRRGKCARGGVGPARPAGRCRPSRRRWSRLSSRREAAAIEVDVAGVKVTIKNGALPATIAAVLGALKGTP